MSQQAVYNLENFLVSPQGGLDILAPARSINTEIYDPLAALSPKPAVTKFEFPFGTHTGYQVRRWFFGKSFFLLFSKGASPLPARPHGTHTGYQVCHRSALPE